MKKSDKITYQQKEASQLQKDLLDLKKQLVEIKAQHALAKLKDTSKLSKIRYQIALIYTELSKQNEKNTKK